MAQRDIVVVGRSAGVVEAASEPPRGQAANVPTTVFGVVHFLDRGTSVLPRILWENRHRPAIDPMFRSAARPQGPRLVDVLFSESPNEGTAGLHAVEQQGGTDRLEAAPSTAVRGLEQPAAPARRMAACALERSHAASASTFTEEAMAGEHHAAVVRGVLERSAWRAPAVVDSAL